MGLLAGANFGMVAAADPGTAATDSAGQGAASDATHADPAGVNKAPAPVSPRPWTAYRGASSTATTSTQTQTKVAHATCPDREATPPAAKSESTSPDVTAAAESTSAAATESTAAATEAAPEAAPESPAASAEPAPPTTNETALDGDTPATEVQTPATEVQTPPATEVETPPAAEEEVPPPATATSSAASSEADTDSDTAETANDTIVPVPTTDPIAATTEAAPPPATTVAAETAPTEPAISTLLTPVAPAETTVPTVGAAAAAASPPPVTADAITTIQYVLTSVSQVVDQVVAPLVARCDLCSLLSLITGNPDPSPNGGGNNAWPPTAENAVLLSPPAARFAHTATIHGLAGLLVPGALADPQSLGEAAATSLTHDVTSSGYTAPTPSSVVPVTAQNILEHALRAALVPASLTALAALSLPGLGGLLFLCAAGTRVGYRQAKASMALHAPAMRRFAATGVLGITHGALVALRPPPRSPAAQVQARPTLLDDVA
jgi:hypothetical protein